MNAITWFLLSFLNFFAATINYQAGKELEPIFNLSIGTICIVMLTLCFINSGIDNDNDRNRIEKNDKKLASRKQKKEKKAEKER